MADLIDIFAQDLKAFFRTAADYINSVGHAVGYVHFIAARNNSKAFHDV